MKQTLLTLFFIMAVTLCSMAQVANGPQVFELCDDNEDGIMTFDLSFMNAPIIGNQNQADFSVTYFNSQADADTNSNALPIIYTNTNNPETIIARVTDNSSGNFDTTTVDLIVIQSADAGFDGAIEICSNGSSEDLFNVLGGSPQSGGFWTPSLSSGTGIFSPAVDSPGTYTYTLSGVAPCTDSTATVTVSIASTPTINLDSSYAICGGESTIIDTGLNLNDYTIQWFFNNQIIPDATLSSLTVNQAGNYNVQVNSICGITESPFQVIEIAPPSVNTQTELFACSFDGSGFAEFDLTQASAQIVGSQSDLIVTYYESQADAQAEMNPIANPAFYINNQPSFDIVYARVEDNSSDCVSYAFVYLTVSGVAPINPISDLVVCDINMDGITTFNLQSKNDEILVNQNNFELFVSYHETETDALNLTNSISDPYTNITNPQVVYVAVSDYFGCGVEIQSFNLVADQTCMPCQTITPSIDSTVPEINASGIVVAQQLEDVSFTGTAIFSTDNSDATYTWDFGNGITTSGTTVTQQFVDIGSYTVTLTVSDNNPEGCAESTTIQVQILDENLVVDQSQFSVEELVQNVLIGNECSQISNIVYSTGTDFAASEANGIGYFLYEGSDFPFSEGLVLSTGEASDASGPNDSNSSSGSNAWPGDADLDAALNLNSNNATFIEFDFVPVVNQINFDFLMASEEYDGGSFECQFSDAFAFLLTDASGVTTNLAVIPGTDIPITVTNIHEANASCPAANSEFFAGYTPINAPPIAYNGRTVSFTAQANVNIGEIYHIKLVIADDGDSAFDSAVFLNAGSFDIGGICDDIGLISMRAFNDTNTNGTFDTDETRFSNGSFTYEKNNDGIVNVVNSSTGSFTIISTDENDTYDVTFSVNDAYSNCYTQNIQAFNDVNVPFGDLIQVDFPIEDNLTCEDVAVYLINPWASPRPGFEHNNLLIVENLSGATIASGSVDFVLDEDLSIINTTLSSANVSLTPTATGFTLDFTNLQPSQSETVDIRLLCPTTLDLDEIVTNTATYTTTTNDIVAENNVSTLSEIVIGSYDPNDKMEAQGPEIIHDDFITTDEYLYYTIRFQNIGTAEAIFVRIEDELDAQLDEDTFQMLRSSHDYVVTRTGNELEWFFDDINLPAEEDDAEGSIGYVYFKIKPKAGYLLGDIIPNSAAIYFDFNVPIITNTFTTTFSETLSVDTFDTIDFSMFPNPAKEEVTIQLASSNFETGQITLYNIQGKAILKDMKFENNTSTIDISSLESGLYFVELTVGNTSIVQKLMVD